MSQDSGGKVTLTVCDFIAAFVCTASFLVMHQIDVTSAHFAAAFNIPIHNIGIYFSKLFSFRSLLIASGSTLEYIISKTLEKIVGPEADPARNRKYLSLVSLCLLILSRGAFLLSLHFLTDLSYYTYAILSLEALFFGSFHTSFLAIAPEHTVSIAFAVNFSRVLIFITQTVIDLIWHENPLLMIKIQSYICLSISLISLCLWTHFIVSCGSGPRTVEDQKKPEVAQNRGKKPEGPPNHVTKAPSKDFMTTLKDAFSPFMMYYVGCLFRDFLYPGLLPFALLERKKCHPINMLVPISNMIGPAFLFSLEVLSLFKRWSGEYNSLWLLTIPMIIITAMTLQVIHTRAYFVRSIARSRWRVLLMTLAVICCHGFLDPFSFAGVAKVVKPIKGGDNGKNDIADSIAEDNEDGDNGVITLHSTLAWLLRFLFAKISVGYNDVRVSLGYTLPRFRPKHRMSKWNLFWYIFNNTFRRVFKDIQKGFRTNIKNYL